MRHAKGAGQTASDGATIHLRAWVARTPARLGRWPEPGGSFVGRGRANSMLFRGYARLDDSGPQIVGCVGLDEVNQTVGALHVQPFAVAVGSDVDAPG